jgi:hypothetical protein
MHKKTSFMITIAILVYAAVTMAFYNVNFTNAQSDKTMNMTAGGGGGNMSKTMNMTAGGGGGNITNSTHHKATELKRMPGL